MTWNDTKPRRHYAKDVMIMTIFLVLVALALSLASGSPATGQTIPGSATWYWPTPTGNVVYIPVVIGGGYE